MENHTISSTIYELVRVVSRASFLQALETDTGRRCRFAQVEEHASQAIDAYLWALRSRGERREQRLARGKHERSMAFMVNQQLRDQKAS